LEAFDKKPSRDSIEKIILPEREIKINDVHYARLCAVVEAESGEDAVRKYIKDKIWQVLRESEEHDSGEGDVPAEEWRITRMEMEKGYGPVRTELKSYEKVQMTNFKISKVNQPDKLVWVYKLGKHWVICS